MKALASREYLSRTGIGDWDACGRLVLGIDRAFQELAKQKTIRGSLTRILESREHLDEEGIDPGPVLPVCDGRFPAVWSTVTYDADAGVEQFRRIEVEFDLALTNSQTVNLR